MGVLLEAMRILVYLKAIDELNIPIDFISGTSIGSFIGALYASGNLTQFEEEIRNKNSFHKRCIIQTRSYLSKISSYEWK